MNADKFRFIVSVSCLFMCLHKLIFIVVALQRLATILSIAEAVRPLGGERMYADSPIYDRQSLDIANILPCTPEELPLETQPVMLRVTVDTCGTVMDPAVGMRSHDVESLHHCLSLSSISPALHFVIFVS